MKLFYRTHFLFVLTAAFFGLFVHSFAHADTYEFLPLGTDADHETYAISDSGDVVVVLAFLGDGCQTPADPYYSGFCYDTFVDGKQVEGSMTPPILVQTGDGPAGSGCPPLPTDVSISFSTCVNGHEVFATANGSDRSVLGLFDGPDLVADKIIGADVLPSFIEVDSFGDIAYDDTLTEELYEAVDQTTHSEVPEPGSLILLGTGIAAVLGAIGRRLS